MDFIDTAIRNLPAIPEWQKEVRIDHIYTEALLQACSVWGIKSLGEVAAGRRGKLVCSTEQLGPAPNIYDDVRIVSAWIPPYSIDKPVQFHYSSKRVRSDTLRSNLADGNKIALIAEFHAEIEEAIIFHPLVMGFPWLEAAAQADFDPMWLAFDFYEHYIEDFDEFSRVKDVGESTDVSPMKAVSEHAFKICLSKILGDSPPRDWGGEQSDFFSAHLHLSGRRLKAAFILKGPARFEPMKLTHLGKNANQIVRLAHEPAEILFLQHSHDILSDVRETLRAFAVQPSRPRRYCLIDGVTPSGCCKLMAYITKR